jgi:penicillin amidase
VTANNQVVDNAESPFLSRHYDPGYRAQRIVELLSVDTVSTAASSSRHQMDIVDIFARANRSAAASAAQAAGRSDLADRLRAWDGSMQADAIEPTLFWTWYRELQRLTYEDESPDYGPAEPLHRWLRVGGEIRWFDDVRTAERESLDTLSRRAMQSTLADRRLAPWGDVHETVMEHPLAAVPIIGRLLGFRIGPLSASGSNYTVSNASSFARRQPFSTSYGPSMRHVVDMGDPDAGGGFIIPTGQSGHPLSRHYRDQTEQWQRGGLWVLPLDVTRVRAQDTMTLLPHTVLGSGSW